MSDWDFLHSMHDEGYSPEQIAEAAACGYNPWEHDNWDSIEEFVDDDEDWDCDEEPKNPTTLELWELLDDLIRTAQNYLELTGRHLPIYGELGELYGEAKYGIKRHKPFTQGSDGKLGKDFVEIKTISPHKSDNTVLVKRAGNFNRLLIVKISVDFKFKSKMIDRKSLRKGSGKHFKAKWSE
ncbi:hypothetical protein [Aliiglaciecola sp. M165]|uniref:hypothetical protein n=1 Tax=Aliiglaciecola sp. M165 TaxID=2593649 RepID=UPI00117F8C26|nr:hypothetical protein [Aliiglaciecola sp. M165]TRY29767.1 hypothetical protein FM019_16475 [Aliiglaciecola sp. M165]